MRKERNFTADAFQSWNAKKAGKNITIALLGLRTLYRDFGRVPHFQPIVNLTMEKLPRAAWRRLPFCITSAVTQSHPLLARLSTIFATLSIDGRSRSDSRLYPKDRPTCLPSPHCNTVIRIRSDPIYTQDPRSLSLRSLGPMKET